MANMTDIMALVRVAKTQVPSNPLGFLTSLLNTVSLSQQSSGGLALPGTSEAGGSVSFSIPNDMTQSAYIRLIEEAIEWLSG
jgi:hypothetical protein